MSNRIGDSLTHTGENRRLVHALLQAQVDFIVIGGLAMAWYFPERQADDMDLLVDSTQENSERIANAFLQLNLRGFSFDSFTRPGLQISIKQIYYAELLTPALDDPNYSTTKSTAVPAKLFGYDVLLAARHTLRYMKIKAVQSTGGAEKLKHANDLALLEKENSGEKVPQGTPGGHTRA